jgi:REP element-mobilizing transposase RayT
MARPLRIEFAGALQHIISRGNARKKIFADERDFTSLLAVLDTVVEKYNWVIYAYCLMPNHYHLVAETPEANLSAGMKYLNGVYTQRFNRRHDQTGHLLQGRYKSILIDRHAYLLELCRYVVLNPVRAGLTSDPHQWRWSSFAPTMKKAPKPRCLDPGIVLALFADDRTKARKDYSQFVVEGIGKKPSWGDSEGSILLGDNRFLREVIPLVSDRACAGQLARLEQVANRPPLEQLLQSSVRNRLAVSAIKNAHIKHGYHLRDIANFLGVDPSTLTRAINQNRPSIKTWRNAICEL